jgi:hypothetical protein
VSIFRNAKGAKGSTRQVRLRHLLPLVVLMLVPIFLAQAGSAARPPLYKFELCVQNASSSPACGPIANSVFDGNTTPTVNVSVENDSSSTSAIQSAQVTFPNQLRVVSGSPASNVTVSGQQVVIHGIRVQPGRSFTATFQVNTACGGQFAWSSAPADQKAASEDNLGGTPFNYQSGSSTGVTTSLTTTATVGCHLAFVAQPTDTKPGFTITDAGASQPGAVKVGLFVGTTTTPMTTCPVGYASCTVTVGQMPVDGSTLSNSPGSLTQALVGTGERVATYSNLSITGASTPKQFRLKASADGDFAPFVTSGSFLIADDVEPAACDLSGHCTITQKTLHHGDLIDSFADLVGVTNFTFMTLSPFALSSTPQGCEGRVALPVAGFAESDNRAAGSGALTVRYYINHDLLKAKYGVNVGQQFIAICAGGRPVDTRTGTIYDCNDPNSPVNHDVLGQKLHGWVGDEVKNGKFTGKTANAVCNDDGYYWGIIGSYQDKLPAGNPIVTNWGGQNIGGDNFRFFDINVPAGWDWRSGP